MTRRPTLTDIAKIVGVTPMVVSDVLKHRTDRIGASAATREHILRVAKELNYRPNGSARAMRQNRFHNIGYLSLQNADDYTVEAIESGICDVTNRRNYRVTLIKHRFDWDPVESEIPDYYREAHLDALIVNNWRHSLPPIVEKLLMSVGFPILFFNDKRPHNSVYCDDVLGTQLLVQHLLNQGYRRITYLAFDQERIGTAYSHTDRQKTYEQLMTHAGLEPVVVPAKYEHILEMMKNSRPEAVVCENDNQTYFVQRVLYELGLRCPDDLAIGGFNGELMARNSPVPLTTIHIPFLEMARRIADMAIDLSEAPTSGPAASIKFTPELMVEVSTQKRTPRAE